MSPSGGGSRPLPARWCVAVAFSGGRDSLALLHATCRAAGLLQIEVVAIHVHHGLLPEADAWLSGARALVARWRRRGWPVRLAEARLAGSPAPGDSVEAWARAGRHAALARLAREAGATLLMLAHHRRDQAETVLLQALRGAGPAGLAAMPRTAQRAGLTWARPWLDQPRTAIEAYVRRHRLRPVEDPSNDDIRYARNRLRAVVWPAFSAAFPEAEVALAAVARRAQEADAALAELAALDLAACTDARGRLHLASWRGLSPARQANALRAWWWQRTGRGAPQTLVSRLLDELPQGLPADASPPGHRRWPAVDGDEAVARGGWLWLQPAAGHTLRPGGDLGRSAAGSLEGSPARPTRRSGTGRPPPPPPLAGVPAPTPVDLDLSRPGTYPVPGWPGHLVVEACREQGASPDNLRRVSLRPRAGGEQFQLGPGRPPRRLKKQYQAQGLADGPDRHGPLVWQGERLLFVPGLGLDARAWAPPGVAQLTLRWQPGPVPVGCPAGSPSGPDKPAG